MSARLVLLSDLHLGDGTAGDEFHADAPLVSMLEAIASDGGVKRLVLLGDVFELADRGGHDRPVDRSLARLAAVLRAHHDVAAALRTVRRQGTHVVVVRGNHDAELARAAVWAALVRALDAGVGGGRLELVPWLWHVPGLVLAEHGHQHHDINAFDHVLHPYVAADDGPLQQPFGAQLARLRDHHRGELPRVAVAALAAREAARMADPVRRLARRHYRRNLLRDYAGEVDLPADIVAGLDRLTEPHAWAVLRRLAHGRGDPRARQYLPTASARVEQELGPAAPPFLVYGHTHAADAQPLGVAGRSTYLNTGTWCRRGPEPGATTLQRRTRTWVEIDCSQDGRALCARVAYWTEAGHPEVLAEVADGVVTRAPNAGFPAALHI